MQLSSRKCVKNVTEAALLATDSLERDGIVFQKMESRKKYPFAELDHMRKFPEQLLYCCSLKTWDFENTAYTFPVNQKFQNT